MTTAVIDLPIWKIYRVTNLVNGMLYIGQTKKSLARRWQGHVAFSKRPSNHMPLLMQAIIEYGEDNFLIEQIDERYSHTEALEAEIFFISFYNSFMPNGYNMTLGGDGHPGQPASAKTRAKMSLARKGRPGHIPDEKTRQKLREAHLGKSMPPETRAKIAEANRGKRKIVTTPRPPRSAATRALLSAAQKGKKHTPEARSKMRAAKLGKKRSPEACEAVARSRRGVPRSPEIGAKVAAALRGRQRPRDVVQRAAAARAGYRATPETRAKISAAQRGRPKHDDTAREKIRQAVRASWAAGEHANHKANYGRKRRTAQQLTLEV